MLGYAATTDIHNVPIVVVDGDRSPASRRLDRALRGVAVLRHRRTRSRIRGRSTPTWRGAAPGWRSCAAGLWRARLDTPPDTNGPSRDGHAGHRRRHRRELVRRRAGVRPGPRRRVQRGRWRNREGGRAAGHRRARPGLVQPRSREPGLHGARRAGAAAACHHGQPDVDGDRARARARHARSAERHAARPLGADSRQAAAVRAGRLRRRAARGRGRRVLVRGAAARQRRAAARGQPGLSALHARTGPVRLDDLGDAAAGDDDGDVLLPDADDLPLGIHLPDREHAAGDSVGDDAHSAAVLPRDRPRHLPEGRRASTCSGRSSPPWPPGAWPCSRWRPSRSRKRA